MSVSLFFLDHGYHMEPLRLAEKPRAITTPRSPTQRGEEIVRKLHDALTWAQTSMAAAQNLQEE